MRLFSGSCKHCQFVWETVARMPNFCPECGKQLFKSFEERKNARTRIHDCRGHVSSHEIGHNVITHEMGQ